MWRRILELQKIRTNVRRNLANIDSAEVSDGDLNDVINSIYKEIARKYRFSILDYAMSIQTQAGKNTYTIPQNVIRISKPFYINGQKLKTCTDRQKFPFGTTTESPPIAVLLDKRQITLYPTPDDVYTINFIGNVLPDDLVNDTDEPFDGWENCIIAGSTMRIMLMLRDDYVKNWVEMYQYYMNELIQSEETYKVEEIGRAF